MLSTALVSIKDNQGASQTGRALLDSGSQSNFITEDLVRRLGLTTRSINIPVVGINQAWSQIQEMVKVTVSSKYNAFNITIDCLVLKRISDRLPNFPLDKKSFMIPHNIRLADPTFHESTDIELLLGAEVFWNVLCIGQTKKSSDHPLLQKTLFGWILGGTCSPTHNQSRKQQCNLAINSSNVNLDNAKFWQVQQVSNPSAFSAEERKCEAHFERTHSRNEEGRFVVELPLKKNLIEQMGNSYETALSRFYTIERKLNRDPALKEQYTQFIEEYRALGHMRLVESDDSSSRATYYLPHHAVLRPSSSTTKLRVVFDASCKTDSGISLNDALKVGPTLQQDVFTTIIKFRKWQYALTADV